MQQQRIMNLTKEEYFARASEREPILKEILAGYVSGRFDLLKERIPLDLFSCVEESPSRKTWSLEQRRDRFMNELCGLEGTLLEGGYGPYNVIALLAGGYGRTEQSSSASRVFNELPDDVAKKAFQAYNSNPFGHPQPNPDDPESYSGRLGGWDGLSHPVIFRKHFTFLRAFLDGMAVYLESCVPK